MVAVTAGAPAAVFRPVCKEDIDLERRLANFLYQRHVPGSQRVLLDARGGEVAVSGELPTRYAKWLCIECCRRVAGVIKVVDNLRVVPQRAKSLQLWGRRAEPQRLHDLMSAACQVRRSLAVAGRVRVDWRKSANIPRARPEA